MRGSKKKFALLYWTIDDIFSNGTRAEWERAMGRKKNLKFTWIVESVFKEYRMNVSKPGFKVKKNYAKSKIKWISRWEMWKPNWKKGTEEKREN